MTITTAADFVEKAPLERYVGPARPSLVGMSRAELAVALGRSACRKRSARCGWRSFGIGSMSAGSRISAP